MRALKILGIIAGVIFILVIVGVPIQTKLTQKRNVAELQELKVFFDTHPNGAAVTEFLKRRNYNGADLTPIDDDSRAFLVEYEEIDPANAARAVELIECSKPIGGEGFWFGRDVDVTALFDSSGNLVQHVVFSHLIGP